ncbi:hypothetical protein LPJ57_010460, partial [Coemansia sp. RSA 486]
RKRLRRTRMQRWVATTMTMITRTKKTMLMRRSPKIWTQASKTKRLQNYPRSNPNTWMLMIMIPKMQSVSALS